MQLIKSMAKWDIKLKHKIAAIKTLECETHPQNLINKVLRDIESIVSHQSAMKVHCSSQDACGIAVSKWSQNVSCCPSS